MLLPAPEFRYNSFMVKLKPLNVEKKGSTVRRGNFFTRYKVSLIVLAVLTGFFFWANSSGETVFNIVFNRELVLKESDGKVNVLLLGVAGKGHDGPNLTDTIMVASFDISTKRVNLISLPRDLWLDEQKTKVNTLYQIGLNKGVGLNLAKEWVGKILGLNIPYAVRVDFSGFTRAVDLVGGIEVPVERSFDDYSYPVPGKENELCGYKEEERELNEEEAKKIGSEQVRLKILLDPGGQIAAASVKPGTGIVYTDQQVFKLFPCRFERLNFKQGLTTMDGPMALKFVRSRHGTNNEGTDFARSKRQQLVLQAFKDQILSLETFINPKKMIELAQTFEDSVEIDIPQSHYVEFAKLLRKTEEVKSYVINGEGIEPLLVTPPTGQYGAWVLIPPNNDFSKIHRYISDILSGIEASASAKQD